MVEVNDEARETCSTNNRGKVKTSMIRSSLCDYSDAYIHVKATITIPNTAAAGLIKCNANKKIIFKNYAPFTNFISEIRNTQVCVAHDIDVAISLCNLMEYIDINLKTSGHLWQHYKDDL